MDGELLDVLLGDGQDHVVEVVVQLDVQVVQSVEEESNMLVGELAEVVLSRSGRTLRMTASC